MQNKIKNNYLIRISCLLIYVMIKISNIITLISVNPSSTDPLPKARTAPAFPR